MKKRIRWKSVMAIFMVGIMLLAVGCASKGLNAKQQDGVSDGNSDPVSANNTSSTNDELGNDANAKGRYVEEDFESPENTGNFYDFRVLQDGSIALLDQAGLYSSNDGGRTFSVKNTAFMDLFDGDAYISMAAIGSDGSVFAVKIVAGTEQLSYECYFISAAGDISKIPVNTDELGNGQMSGCTITENGTILTALGDKVYELAADTGEIKLKFTASGSITQIREAGDYIYVCTEEAVQCFKTENGEEAIDEVLANVKEYLPSGSTAGSDERAYPLVFSSGDSKETVHIATSEGLFRHVVGGSVLEEVIQGQLSSLADPSFSLQGMLQLADESFLIAYKSSSGFSLKHYVYDSQAPTVPPNRLVVYSLEENIEVRQVISEYQKKSRDTYIEYMVGMSGQDGITKEDAIRNLNTAVLSGEGPDIIILDGLPMDSYVEKGILADLSDLFENKLKDQEFFENVQKSYEQDGKLFAVPARFLVPVVAGEKEIVDQITDLDSFATALKALREKSKEGSLIDASSAEYALRKLYPVNSPAWFREDGSIKKEELVHFLEQAKEIYDLEKAGNAQYDNSAMEKLEIMEEENLKASSDVGGDPLLKSGFATGPYYMNQTAMLICNISSVASYSWITSAFEQLVTGHAIDTLAGQSEGVFSPQMILGINAQSSNQELAQDFLAAIYSADMQKSESPLGFPINKQAFAASSIDTTDEGASQFSIIGKDDGQRVDLNINWPTEEQLAHLSTMLEGLTTPAVTNSEFRDTFLALAPEVLNGDKNAEDAADEIINKMQISLSE